MLVPIIMPPAIYIKSEPTFKVVYDELIAYLESRPKSLSASSRRSLQASFNNLSELHKMKFKSIDYDMLQTEISKNNKLSKSSMNNIKNLLHKMYNLALKKKCVAEDVSRICDYDFKEQDEEIHTIFTKDEIQAIYNDAQSDERDMLLILLYTGIRIQELLILETKSIHLEEHYFITGVKTEAGKNRTVPIHDDILPIIKAHYKPKEHYFWGLQGSQRIYQTLRWRFERYLKTLSFTHLPHDTRHTAATLMKDTGIDEMYIKLILGHRINDVTQKVYIHTKPETLVQQINQVKFI